MSMGITYQTAPAILLTLAKWPVLANRQLTQTSVNFQKIFFPVSVFHYISRFYHAQLCCNSQGYQCHSRYQWELYKGRKIWGRTLQGCTISFNLLWWYSLGNTGTPKEGKLYACSLLLCPTALPPNRVLGFTCRPWSVSLTLISKETKEEWCLHFIWVNLLC